MTLILSGAPSMRQSSKKMLKTLVSNMSGKNTLVLKGSTLLLMITK